MNSNTKKNNSLLFNLITLLTFGLTLFLIIFLKQGKGKKFEQKKKNNSKEKSRVKISTQPEEEGKIEENLNQLNQRQIKILKRIEQDRVMEPNEIYELVPNVSTRTVRRDMDKLVESGFVSQKGTTKSTQYIFKG